MLAFGVVYPDPGALDDNFGLPLYFWFGKDLNPASTLADLKQSLKFKYFTPTNAFQHQNDNMPPVFKVEYFHSQERPDETIALMACSQVNELQVMRLRGGLGLTDVFQFLEHAKV